MQSTVTAAVQSWRWIRMKISDNAAETIRRILDNGLTYYFIRLIVWIGSKIFTDEVGEDAN